MTLRRQLARAVQQGAALALVAGCASESAQESATDTGEAGEGNTASLEPYPRNELSCMVVPVPGGTSTCCVSPHCYLPEPGESCVVADSAELAALLPDSVGSPLCRCKTEASPVSGPYASREGEAPGACCYVLGSLPCRDGSPFLAIYEGRPLFVAGEPVVARVLRRGDWIGTRGVA